MSWRPPKRPRKPEKPAPVIMPEEPNFDEYEPMDVVAVLRRSANLRILNVPGEPCEGRPKQRPAEDA